MALTWEDGKEANFQVFQQPKYQKCQAGSWRDDSVIKSIYNSSRGPESSSQHPHLSHLHLLETPAPGNWNLASTGTGFTTHACCTHRHACTLAVKYSNKCLAGHCGECLYAFNLNTKEAEAGGLCELKSSLVYIASSKSARAIYYSPL